MQPLNIKYTYLIKIKEGTMLRTLILFSMILLLSGCWKSHMATYIDADGQAESAWVFTLDGTLLDDSDIHQVLGKVNKGMNEQNYSVSAPSKNGDIYRIKGQKPGLFLDDVHYECNDYLFFEECSLRYAEVRELDWTERVAMPEIQFTIILPADTKVVGGNHSGYETKQGKQVLHWRYKVKPENERVKVDVNLKFRL